tara:strand:+ start:609 stop:1217 length:609 start_codon:yes stop_codon:yes gene_type:complete
MSIFKNFPLFGRKKSNPPAFLLSSNLWTAGPFLTSSRSENGGRLHVINNDMVIIPQAPGELSALLMRGRDLSGSTEMVLRYRIEGDGVAKPHDRADGYTSISLYFQRAGDDWSARGAFESYRWYSPVVHHPIRAGSFELGVPFSANWTAVMGSNRTVSEAAFVAAQRECYAMGVAFGNSSGRMHGIYAEGDLRFIVESFDIL